MILSRAIIGLSPTALFNFTANARRIIPTLSGVPPSSRYSASFRYHSPVWDTLEYGYLTFPRDYSVESAEKLAKNTVPPPILFGIVVRINDFLTTSTPVQKTILGKGVKFTIVGARTWSGNTSNEFMS